MPEDLTFKMQENWSTIVPSDTLAIAVVCERIISGLKEADFSEDDVFAVHLALEEAFINAVKHGNRLDPAKKIQIEYARSEDKVQISITDEGEGFNPSDVPDPRVGDNLYKADGRGILLMQSYMDEVKFNERGNHVDMVRYKCIRKASSGRSNKK